MTKQSANPRRYSRGPAGLDPAQPLSVYLAVHVHADELSETIERIEYLAAQHPDAVVDLAGLRYESSELCLTLEVNMGPARQALRGDTTRLYAGYDFLWAAVKTLYYATPILCGQPHPNERENVNHLGERTRFRPTAHDGDALVG